MSGALWRPTPPPLPPPQPVFLPTLSCLPRRPAYHYTLSATLYCIKYISILHQPLSSFMPCFTSSYFVTIRQPPTTWESHINTTQHERCSPLTRPPACPHTSPPHCVHASDMFYWSYSIYECSFPPHTLTHLPSLSTCSPASITLPRNPPPPATYPHTLPRHLPLYTPTLCHPLPRKHPRLCPSQPRETQDLCGSHLC